MSNVDAERACWRGETAKQQSDGEGATGEGVQKRWTFWSQKHFQKVALRQAIYDSAMHRLTPKPDASTVLPLTTNTTRRIVDKRHDETEGARLCEILRSLRLSCSRRTSGRRPQLELVRSSEREPTSIRQGSDNQAAGLSRADETQTMKTSLRAYFSAGKAEIDEFPENTTFHQAYQIYISLTTL